MPRTTRGQLRDGFHPRRSTTTDATLAGFIRAPITGVLTEVPFISGGTVQALAGGSEPITNTHQLIGKFLALSPQRPNCVEHCDRFYKWLLGKNVAGTLVNNIVEAIAEKVEVMMTGVYTPEDFDN
ncbi:conserved unknown protein [Ectocarpus siliculosus]|uniref:Uncharacterized protein n=1 Tax=Ectocarpus siliculosus TaxID=2880 RepID=D7FY55_ECTSI|nr:conserved unknown protein [Ectocarpus siliculosus]|eukprot:CBJ26494.1 conserved unknown protein [Ectocarpus siliculosus]